jgi:hypothetical protein
VVVSLVVVVVVVGAAIGTGIDPGRISLDDLVVSEGVAFTGLTEDRWVEPSKG